MTGIATLLILGALASPQSKADRLSQYVNTGQDASPALRNAIAAVARGDSTEVVLPVGTLTLRSPVELSGLAQKGRLRGATTTGASVLLIRHNGPALQFTESRKRKYLHSSDIGGFTIRFATNAFAKTPKQFGIAFRGNPSGADGDVYWSKLHDLSIVGSYVGIGILPLPGAKNVPIWGNRFSDLRFEKTHKAALWLRGAKIGQPSNTFERIFVHGGGSGSAAFTATAIGGSRIDLLNVEDWKGGALDVVGLGALIIDRVRTERLTIESGRGVVFIANSPCEVRGLDAAKTSVMGSGPGYLLRAEAGANIKLSAYKSDASPNVQTYYDEQNKPTSRGKRSRVELAP